MSYQVQIGEELAADDGWQQPLVRQEETQAWWDVPLPACPDCSEELVWYEAGYVPGTRKCQGCGSLFHVDAEPERGLFIRRERLY